MYEQTYGPRTVRGGTEPPKEDGGFGICNGGPCDEESPKPNYKYAGPGKGGYVQECKYKYVGTEEGEYEMITVKRKKPNYTLCFGLASSMILIGILAFAAREQPATLDSPAGGLDNAAAASKDDPFTASPKYGCFPQGLDHGERVRAAAAISFEPAGLVQEGAMGTVVLDGPDGDDGQTPSQRAVIVTWDGIPGLKNSKVTRDMIVRTIQNGDAVESLVNLEYRTKPGYTPPPAPLDVTDLVRATQDLGSVRSGTYGTVVAVVPGEPDRAVVSFANQLDTVKVHKSHINKVPQMGDEVRATQDITGKDYRLGGVATVPAGTLGFVSAVSPAEDGMAYTFSVDWSTDKKPRIDSDVGKLQVLVGHDGQIVSIGSRGRVLEAPESNPRQPRDANSLFIVDWERKRGPGSMVRRDQVKRSDVWDDAKLNFCCSTGKFCPKNGDAGAASLTPSAPSRSPAPAAPAFNCGQGAEEAWAVDKAAWCCREEARGCLQRPGGPVARPQAPANSAPPPPPPPSGPGIV